MNQNVISIINHMSYNHKSNIFDDISIEENIKQIEGFFGQIKVNDTSKNIITVKKNINNQLDTNEQLNNQLDTNEQLNNEQHTNEQLNNDRKASSTGGIFTLITNYGAQDRFLCYFNK